MIQKIRAAFDVLHQGRVVADPATWKRRDLAVSALGVLFASLYAAARAFGLDVPINLDDLDALAAGVVAVVWMYHGWSTAATSDKVGLPNKRPPDHDRGASAESVTEWDAEYRHPGGEP